MSPAEQSYRNTVYCAGLLALKDGTISGRYCGNRWCLVCNRLRTARSINRYGPVLKSWGARWFVTLTAPNVPAPQLRAEIRRYLTDFTRCKRAIVRTHRLSFVAVRKLECTYNARTDTYHPHFHCIVESEAAARTLLAEWLALRTDAVADAQDVRRADANDVVELFKYFTKLVSKTSRTGTIAVRVCKAAALDVVFQAMKGTRVFQPVGFTLPPEQKDEDGEIQTDAGTLAPARLRLPGGDWQETLYEWSQDAADWVDEYGEALAEYNPSDGMRALVRGISPPPETPCN